MIREEYFGTVSIRCNRRAVEQLWLDPAFALGLWDITIDPTEDPEAVEVSPRTLRGAIAVLSLVQPETLPSTSFYSSQPHPSGK